MVKENKKLTSTQKKKMLETLKSRFEENTGRPESLKWEEVEDRLRSNSSKLWSLLQMEETGGMPDIVGRDENTGAFIFFDCSPESPKGRRKLCYDREALESRKKYKPDGSAVEEAQEMGIELLSEEQYLELQKLGPFDTKTSSWLKTPDEIRKLGGAIFGDFRFGRTFIYHNGAESYYGARGFRGCLKV